jgi:DNA-directed RNA polymerase specialized sigma24 family protein
VVGGSIRGLDTPVMGRSGGGRVSQDVSSAGVRDALNVEPRDFDGFYAEIRAGLAKALVARYGRDLAAELNADVAVYAWEHRDRLLAMENPIGYLYRVAQSKSRRYSRWNRRAPTAAARAESPSLPEPDPELAREVAALPVKQRMCVVLIHGYQWTYEEAAATLGLSVPAVRNQLHRGMRTLRARVAPMEDE